MGFHANGALYRPANDPQIGRQMIPGSEMIPASDTLKNRMAWTPRKVYGCIHFLIVLSEDLKQEPQA